MSFGLYLHAARVARPRQLGRRLSRPVRRRLFPRPAAAVPRPLLESEVLWRSPAFVPRRSEPSGRLALFAAGYGDDVLEAARAGDAAAAAQLAARWIAANPPRPGDAWHPYVVSTRIANWVAALTLAPSLATPAVGESLRTQLRYLMRNVEHDILGNHVIRNAKALVLGGRSLGDDAAERLGRRLLRRELPEQVLADGGHYERSPAYHRLVLLDLLEVAPWTEVTDVVARMRDFAAASSRPDGQPALFNDGGVDIAPPLELPEPPDGLDVRASTGYAFARRPALWLAFDCGAPAPPYLPAHAHADALSFQLWLAGRPAVVDPGTSTYDPGETRRRERGTAAHSTIAVDGDQFALWGSFRSGPLPEVRLVDATESSLVGEATLPTGVRIIRALRLGESSLLVEDRVEGTGVHDLVSSVPTAPGAGVRVDPLAGTAELEQRTLAERFGETVPAPALVQRVQAALPWEGGWRLDWGGSGR
jgi:heparinase II/III-like protein